MGFRRDRGCPGRDVGCVPRNYQDGAEHERDEGERDGAFGSAPPGCSLFSPLPSEGLGRGLRPLREDRHAAVAADGGRAGPLEALECEADAPDRVGRGLASFGPGNVRLAHPGQGPERGLGQAEAAARPLEFGPGVHVHEPTLRSFCLSGCFSKPLWVVWRGATTGLPHESPPVSGGFRQRQGLRRLLGCLPVAGRVFLPPVWE